MLRSMLANKGTAVRAVPSANAVARAVASGTSTQPDIQNETWVEAAVNLPTGEAEFSDPLTVAELEESRQLLEDSFCASVSSAGSDDVDADGQMEHIQVHAGRLAQRQQMSSALNVALVMANNADVQRACMAAMRDDPNVFEAMKQMARDHGMSLEPVDPTQTHSRLAIMASPVATSDDPSREVEPLSYGPLQPLRALLDTIADAVGEVGDAVAAYIARMSRRLNNLMLRLQGVPEADIQPVGSGAGGKGPPGGNLLMDVAVAAASLLVVVAFVGRLGRVPFRR